MPLVLNPFVWSRPLNADPVSPIGRVEAAQKVAALLRGQTVVVVVGQRGIGKSTFAWQVEQALRVPLAQQLRAVGHAHDVRREVAMLYVDLDRAISWPALENALAAAMRQGSFRRAYDKVTAKVKRELGVKVGSIKASVSHESSNPQLHMEIVSRLLEAVRDEGLETVVCLDEFQRIARWNEDDQIALSGILREVCLGKGSGHMGLMMTGSDRAGLAMLTANSRMPIFHQHQEFELPMIDYDELHDYVQEAFSRTGRTIDDEAVGTILALARQHPRSVQRIAHAVWESSAEHSQITDDHVNEAWRQIMRQERGDLGWFDAMLAQGGVARENERAVLYMIADTEGRELMSRHLYKPYGLSNREAVRNALKRLAAQHVVEELPGRWRICDPLLEGWFSHNSPYAG